MDSELNLCDLDLLSKRLAVLEARVHGKYGENRNSNINVSESLQSINSKINHVLTGRERTKSMFKRGHMASAQLAETSRAVYSPLEKNILMKLVKQHSQILESKETCGAMVAKKKATWITLTEQYHKQPGVHKRSSAQLKKLWNNLKSRSKKRFAEHRRAVLQTKGGTPPTPPSPFTEKVLDVVPTILDSVESPSDDDHHSTVVDKDGYSQDCNKTPVRLQLDHKYSKGASISGVSSIGNLTVTMAEFDELERYLNPKLGTNTLLEDKVKVNIILNEEQHIHDTVAQLHKVQELKSVLDSEHIKGVPSHVDKLTLLSKSQLRQEEETAVFSDNVQNLVDNYNSLIHTLSHQFVQWDELVTRLELAAIPKKKM